MRYLTFVPLAIALAGCETTEGFLKQIEDGAYEAATISASEYAKRAKYGPVKAARETARREIRQGGKNGPAGPEKPVPGLDEKTANGKGPVVRIWVEGETVPECVWPDLVK